jgi:hypothetical protein
VAFALFGRFLESGPPDIVLRVLLAAVSFAVMFLPGSASGENALFALSDVDLFGLKVSADTMILAAAAVTLAALSFGVMQHKRMTHPASALQKDEGAPDRGDASSLIAEAKRELG